MNRAILRLKGFEALAGIAPPSAPPAPVSAPTRGLAAKPAPVPAKAVAKPAYKPPVRGTPGLASVLRTRREMEGMPHPRPAFFAALGVDGRPNVWPLALSTNADLAGWLDAIQASPAQRNAVKRTMRCVVKLGCYLKATAADGAWRKTIHGIPEAPVSEEHQRDAIAWLNKDQAQAGEAK